MKESVAGELGCTSDPSQPFSTQLQKGIHDASMLQELMKEVPQLGFRVKLVL
jgi:hypothetical protein